MSQLVAELVLAAALTALLTVYAIGVIWALSWWRRWTALVWPAIALAGLAAQIITWGRQGVQLVAYWRDR